MCDITTIGKQLRLTATSGLQNRIRIAFYSCDHHSWRRVSDAAGIITAVEVSVMQLVSSQLETRQ